MATFFERACGASTIIGQRNFYELVPTEEALVWQKSKKIDVAVAYNVDFASIRGVLRERNSDTLTLLTSLPFDGAIAVDGVVYEPLQGFLPVDAFSQHMYDSLQKIRRADHHDVLRPCGDQLWFIPNSCAQHVPVLKHKRSVQLLPYEDKSVDLFGYGYVCLSTPEFLHDEGVLHKNEKEYDRLTRSIAGLLKYDADELSFDAIDMFVGYAFSDASLVLSSIAFDLSSVASLPVGLFGSSMPLFVERIVEAVIRRHAFDGEFRFVLKAEAIFSDHRAAFAFDADGSLEFRAATGDDFGFNFARRTVAIDEDGRACCFASRLVGVQNIPLTSILEEEAEAVGPAKNKKKSKKKRSSSIAKTTEDAEKKGTDASCTGSETDEASRTKSSCTIVDLEPEDLSGAFDKEAGDRAGEFEGIASDGIALSKRHPELFFRLANRLPTSVIDRFVLRDSKRERQVCVKDVLDDEIQSELREHLPKEAVDALFSDAFDPLCATRREARSVDEIVRSCFDAHTSES